MQLIKKEDLKDVIIDIMNEEYIRKDAICEALVEFIWLDKHKDGEHCGDLFEKITNLVGEEYFKNYNMIARLDLPLDKLEKMEK